ncbi:MAG: hypothetical protein JXB03_00095 [Spirochaetales bacterium]|nr:hypothetical protein [Spirochaetales bacterium]
MKNLTEKVEVEKNNDPIAIPVINEICLHVFNYLKGKTRLNEDQQSDFIVFFHGRIPSIIRNFTYIGIPFEYYLNVHIKYQLLTFLNRARRSRTKNRITANADFIREIFDMYGTDIQNKESDEEKLSQGFSDIVSNRLLIALLTCYDMFPEHMQRMMTSVIGVPYPTFISYTKILSQKTSERKLRFHFLNERRNLAYYRLLQYQQQLNESLTADEKHELKIRIQKCTITLRRLVKELKSVMIHPTHKEISELLEVPKGTVDSSLYYLRNAWAKGKLKKAA